MSAAFADVVDPTWVLTPPPGGGQLPEVSFGGVIDTVAGLIKDVSGWDLRADVTDWIEGDVDLVQRHEQAWQNMGAAILYVQQNLDQGQQAINASWDGNAAAAAAAEMAQWSSALANMSTQMETVSTSLSSSAKQAFELAQEICSTVQTIVSIVTAALSGASIPLWGEWKAVKSVWEAVKLINSARKVISVFLAFIRTLKAAIEGCIAYATSTSLPSPAQITVPTS